jgi:hypothetical protein
MYIGRAVVNKMITPYICCHHIKHATNIVHVIFPHKAADFKLFHCVRREVFLLLSDMLKYERISLIRLLWDFFYDRILLRESSSFGRKFSSLNMNKRG